MGCIESQSYSTSSLRLKSKLLRQTKDYDSSHLTFDVSINNLKCIHLTN